MIAFEVPGRYKNAIALRVSVSCPYFILIELIQTSKKGLPKCFQGRGPLTGGPPAQDAFL